MQRCIFLLFVAVLFSIFVVGCGGGTSGDTGGVIPDVNPTPIGPGNHETGFGGLFVERIVDQDGKILSGYYPEINMVENAYLSQDFVFGDYHRIYNSNLPANLSIPAKGVNSWEKLDVIPGWCNVVVKNTTGEVAWNVAVKIEVNITSVVSIAVASEVASSSASNFRFELSFEQETTFTKLDRTKDPDEEVIDPMLLPIFFVVIENAEKTYSKVIVLSYHDYYGEKWREIETSLFDGDYFIRDIFSLVSIKNSDGSYKNGDLIGSGSPNFSFSISGNTYIVGSIYDFMFGDTFIEMPDTPGVNHNFGYHIPENGAWYCPTFSSADPNYPNPWRDPWFKDDNLLSKVGLWGVKYEVIRYSPGGSDVKFITSETKWDEGDFRYWYYNREDETFFPTNEPKTHGSVFFNPGNGTMVSLWSLIFSGDMGYFRKSFGDIVQWHVNLSTQPFERKAEKIYQKSLEDPLKYYKFRDK